FAALGIALLPLASAVQADELTGTLKKIQQTKTIAIGYRESSFPFSYLNEVRQPVGYSIDLCREVLEDIKSEIGVSDINVNYVLVTPQTRMMMVKNGEVDLECGSTSRTLKREEEVAFSPVIFLSGTKLLVRPHAKIK